MATLDPRCYAGSRSCSKMTGARAAGFALDMMCVAGGDFPLGGALTMTGTPNGTLSSVRRGRRLGCLHLAVEAPGNFCLVCGHNPTIPICRSQANAPMAEGLALQERRQSEAFCAVWND